LAVDFWLLRTSRNFIEIHDREILTVIRGKGIAIPPVQQLSVRPRKMLPSHFLISVGRINQVRKAAAWISWTFSY